MIAKWHNGAESREMARAGNWVMVRRPGCVPYTMFAKEWDALPSADAGRKAITNLTVGGSEFFGKKLCDGRYSADLPYCVAHIQGRDQRQHEAILRESQKRHAAEAQRDEALKALEPFSDMAGEMFARGWDASNVALALDNPNDPHRVTAGDFFAARRVREGGKADG